MRISFVNARGRQVWVHVVRDDGSAVKWPWARHPGLPHDLLHHVVESHLGARHGFWGMVADGADFAFADEAADREPSAPSIDLRGRDLTELVQVEAVVAAVSVSLSTERAGGECSDADCLAEVEQRLTARGLPVPAYVTEESLGDTRAAARRMTERWAGVPEGGTLDLDWPVTSGRTRTGSGSRT